jgi:hypothetical protein
VLDAVGISQEKGRNRVWVNIKSNGSVAVFFWLLSCGFKSEWEGEEATIEESSVVRLG